MRGIGVLVVDDDECTRTLLQEVLTAAGYDVDAVATGDEALERVCARPFSVAILDYELPGTTGVFLHQQIRLLDPALAERSILISGRDLPESTRRYFTRKGVGSLRKPFTLRGILELVQLAVEHPGV